METFDYVIVGAGFAGAVSAERLAAKGHRVLVLDKRPHIAGNAYDRLDDHGILIHPYGPHIFHTNGKRIFEYLSRFTHWRFYEHRVLSQVNGDLYPIPINRTTINKLYRLDLSEAGVEQYLQGVREERKPVRTSEDVVLSSVGRDLCEKFFRNYTRKQWDLDLSELAAGVAARIPTRCNDDDRYFADDFQFMPAQGYTKLFERVLDSPRITVRTATDFFDVREELDYGHLVFTGPIDRYFDYCYGKLPYRSLRFAYQHYHDTEFVQPVGTINFPNDFDHTRTTEVKHLTGQKHRGTSLVVEYPCAEGDPYYPIPTESNAELYRRYRELAGEQTDVTFVGRLAQYKYYNMDQVVGAALAAFDRERS